MHTKQQETLVEQEIKRLDENEIQDLGSVIVEANDAQQNGLNRLTENADLKKNQIRFENAQDAIEMIDKIKSLYEGRANGRGGSRNEQRFANHMMKLKSNIVNEIAQLKDKKNQIDENKKSRNKLVISFKDVEDKKKAYSDLEKKVSVVDNRPKEGTTLEVMMNNPDEDFDLVNDVAQKYNGTIESTNESTNINEANSNVSSLRQIMLEALMNSLGKASKYLDKVNVKAKGKDEYKVELNFGALLSRDEKKVEDKYLNNKDLHKVMKEVIENEQPNVSKIEFEGSEIKTLKKGHKLVFVGKVKEFSESINESKDTQTTFNTLTIRGSRASYSNAKAEIGKYNPLEGGTYIKIVADDKRILEFNIDQKLSSGSRKVEHVKILEGKGSISRGKASIVETSVEDNITLYSNDGDPIAEMTLQKSANESTNIDSEILAEVKKEIREGFKQSADEVVSALRNAMEDDMTWDENEQMLMEFVSDLIDQKFPDEFGFEEMQELMNDPQLETAKDKYIGEGESFRDWFMQVLESLGIRINESVVSEAESKTWYVVLPLPNPDWTTDMAIQKLKQYGPNYDYKAASRKLPGGRDQEFVYFEVEGKSKSKPSNALKKINGDNKMKGIFEGGFPDADFFDENDFKRFLDGNLL